jgi:starvation-inducible DNA-binding protein
MTRPFHDLEEAPPTAPDALDPLVRDLLRLYLLAKHAHWNVTGPQFLPLHRLFDEFAETYRGWADRVAERVRALDAFPDGRPRALTHDDTHELPAGSIDGEEAVHRFLLPVEAVATRVRTALEALEGDDPATQDLLTTVLGGLEHQAWMLRAHR